MLRAVVFLWVLCWQPYYRRVELPVLSRRHHQAAVVQVLRLLQSSYSTLPQCLLSLRCRDYVIDVPFGAGHLWSLTLHILTSWEASSLSPAKKMDESCTLSPGSFSVSISIYDVGRKCPMKHTSQGFPASFNGLKSSEKETLFICYFRNSQ